MFALAISLIDFEELPNHFVAIAKAYQPKKKVPGPFWAVWCRGKILAIYLDPNEALAHMLSVQKMLEAGETPRKQTIDDVNTLVLNLQRRLAAISRAKSSDSDVSP
jgi:hypothetical protein